MNDERHIDRLREQWLEPPEPSDEEECELCGGSGIREMDSPPQEEGCTYAYQFTCGCQDE